MPDRAKIFEFRQRLAVERRRIVNDAASASTIPPAKFLSSLADLDCALSAVEALLDEDRGENSTGQPRSGAAALN